MSEESAPQEGNSEAAMTDDGGGAQASQERQPSESEANGNRDGNQRRRGRRGGGRRRGKRGPARDPETGEVNGNILAPGERHPWMGNSPDEMTEEALEALDNSVNGNRLDCNVMVTDSVGGTRRKGQLSPDDPYWEFGMPVEMWGGSRSGNSGNRSGGGNGNSSGRGRSGRGRRGGGGGGGNQGGGGGGGGGSRRGGRGRRRRGRGGGGGGGGGGGNQGGGNR